MNVTTLPGLVAMGIVVMEMFLIYCMASHDQMFKVLCNFVGGSFAKSVTTMPNLVAIGIDVLEIKKSNISLDLARPHHQTVVSV